MKIIAMFFVFVLVPGFALAGEPKMLPPGGKLHSIGSTIKPPCDCSKAVADAVREKTDIINQQNVLIKQMRVKHMLLDCVRDYTPDCNTLFNEVSVWIAPKITFKVPEPQPGPKGGKP